MKLMTKRLLVVMLTLALTLGMAVSAMAAIADHITDADLQKAGINPANAELIVEWTEVSVPSAGSAASKQTGAAYATANPDGTVTVDLSKGMYLGSWTNIHMFHFVNGKLECKSAPNGAATWNSASPFCLIGEKVEAVDDDDDDDADDDSGSSSSKKSSSKKSSSKSKSPKTGMDESWMLWLIAAGVLAGSSVVAYNKKRG